jgi:hypothetical protein
LKVLATLPDVGLVAGRLHNLPVDAGRATATPYLGIPAPAPNYLLQGASVAPADDDEPSRRWQNRFGVTYGVWSAGDDVGEGATELITIVADPALDQILSNIHGSPRNGLGPWKLVRYPSAFPAAWVSRRLKEASSWGVLYTELSIVNDPDVAWVLAEDNVPPLATPIARKANIKSWDRLTAVVEHDGACLLVVRQTHYPGWFYRINDGPEHPVLKVEGGLQGVELVGSETSRVHFRYRPTGLRQAATVTLAALSTAVLVLIFAGGRVAWRSRKSP